ncbi:unnamed protein product [Pieris macdunnoughi]|uniref:PiggyBac transposable element-derived protein domain-containing protein n=1 Tax=Pieris macdunnoughi TaxID=345717 RepID=A0A821XMP7_9NEOP|nr:unnamed protein product [Pieris macdunnoughi]
MASGSSYEEQQKRLQTLFDAASTPESSKDPFEDDGEYGSDQEYQPSGDESTSSEDATKVSQTRGVRRNTTILSSGESISTSSSDTDDDHDRTLYSGFEELRPIHEREQLSQTQKSESDLDIERVIDESQEADESWCNTESEIPDFKFASSESGITVNIDDMVNVMDFFRLVFPQNFIEYLVNCTNIYGNALCNTNKPHKRHSRRAVYRETNCEEMMKFLGLSLLSGQTKCHNQRKLFSQADTLYYHPIFSYTMSGRRYEQILRCMCVSDLDAKGEKKVASFIDTLTLNFRKVYKPDEQLSLDESLMLFRGRLHFRQYIKSKKARYGLKFYELTSYDEYVLNVKMYSGKEDTDGDVDESKTEKLVLRLMRPYLLHGHHLFMDNFYNSVKFSQKLLDLKTHSTGTLRTNRKDNLKDIVTKKLKKGEHIWARKEKVYVSKRYYALSTSRRRLGRWRL